MFQEPLAFSGRINRVEYVISYVIYFCLSVVVNYLTVSEENLVLVSLHPFSVIQNYLLHADDGLEMVIVMALYTVLLWFLLAQGTKRCHDIGQSGWFQLIPFYMLVLMLREGDSRKNKFGRHPDFVETEPETLDIDFWEKEPTRK